MPLLYGIDMCNKLPYCNPRIDDCLKEEIKFINQNGLKTLSSCCGHHIYPKTIVVQDSNDMIFEFFSGIILNKKKRNRYYKKDTEGYYYIPEILSKNEIKKKEN